MGTHMQLKVLFGRKSHGCPEAIEAIFTVVLRLALHDLIFLFTRIIIQSFAFSPG